MTPVRALRMLLPAMALIGPAGGCSPQQPATSQSAPAPAAAPGAQSSAGTATGAVLETMDAAPYTYVRVRTDTGEIWAAAPQFAVKVGERVVVPLDMPMKEFHSQSLNRTFPLVYFVSQIGREGQGTNAAAAPTIPGMMSAHGSPATPPPAPAQVPEPIAQPPGGTPIATLWANRKLLAGKPVTVRGKVVKFNAGILGHNWIHLQDGTGRAQDGSNDITVTTPEDVAVKVGDTITITGTVVVDKNLGDGYAYAVLIENARLAAAGGK